MSFTTRDPAATQAPGHFQLNPAGRNSFGEFPRRLLTDSPERFRGRRFARFLKFAKTLRGDWQAIPVTQH